VHAGSELLFLSGQVGVGFDGSTSKTIGEQADQVLLNIVTILESQGLSATDIVKLSTYMVVDPEWFVEVEAVACRKTN
jgi:enamine deaminase RidA (YjgF/YER057c/UK114 family)